MATTSGRRTRPCQVTGLRAGSSRRSRLLAEHQPQRRAAQFGLGDEAARGARRHAVAVVGLRPARDQHDGGGGRLRRPAPRPRRTRRSPGSCTSSSTDVRAQIAGCDERGAPSPASPTTSNPSAISSMPGERPERRMIVDDEHPHCHPSMLAAGPAHAPQGQPCRGPGAARYCRAPRSRTVRRDRPAGRGAGMSGDRQLDPASTASSPSSASPSCSPGGRGRSTRSASPPPRSSRAVRWSPRSSSSASPRAGPATGTGRPDDALAGRLGVVGGRGGHAAGGAGAWPRPRTWRSGARPHPASAALRLVELALVGRDAVRQPARRPARRGARLARLRAARAAGPAFAARRGRRPRACSSRCWHLPLVATGQLGAVGLPITFAITLVYVWLFNRTGGSVLLTMVFHIAQGRAATARSGFTGADAARMDWLDRRAVVRHRRSGWSCSTGRRGGRTPGAVRRPARSRRRGR